MHVRANTADSFGEVPLTGPDRVHIISDYYNGNMLQEETQNFGEGIVHSSIIFDEPNGFDQRSIQCSENDEPEPQAVPQQYIERNRTGYTPRGLYESFHHEEPSLNDERI